MDAIRNCNKMVRNRALNSTVLVAGQAAGPSVFKSHQAKAVRTTALARTGASRYLCRRPRAGCENGMAHAGVICVVEIVLLKIRGIPGRQWQCTAG